MVRRSRRDALESADDTLRRHPLVAVLLALVLVLGQVIDLLGQATSDDLAALGSKVDALAVQVSTATAQAVVAEGIARDAQARVAALENERRGRSTSAAPL